VLGETDGVIRLKLRAPAVEGKANAALVAFLAETLRVPKGAVSLKGGRRSRLKAGRGPGTRTVPKRAAGYWRPPVDRLV
jgi:uncharacterized protein